MISKGKNVPIKLNQCRVPRTMLFHIEPKTCPSPWGTPAEECRARLHNGPDARRSCICRHTRYRGTPPNMVLSPITAIVAHNRRGYGRLSHITAVRTAGYVARRCFKRESALLPKG